MCESESIRRAASENWSAICIIHRASRSCDRTASRLDILSLPSRFSPSLSPAALRARNGHAASRHASARGAKNGATRHPGKRSTQVKSHLVAIIPLHAWGPTAALRAAICAPGAASRPAAANCKATHLRTRRELWLICGSAPPLSESNVFLTELRHLYPFSPFTAEIEGSDKQNSQITWFFKKVRRVFCFVFWFEDRKFALGRGIHRLQNYTTTESKKQNFWFCT